MARAEGITSGRLGRCGCPAGRPHVCPVRRSRPRVSRASRCAGAEQDAASSTRLAPCPDASTPRIGHRSCNHSHTLGALNRPCSNILQRGFLKTSVTLMLIGTGWALRLRPLSGLAFASWGRSGLGALLTPHYHFVQNGQHRPCPPLGPQSARRPESLQCAQRSHWRVVRARRPPRGAPP